MPIYYADEVAFDLSISLIHREPAPMVTLLEKIA